MTHQFDKEAAQWDQKQERVIRARDVEKKKKKRCTSTGRALEFGCGTGLLSFALRPFAHTTLLCDPSPGMIETLEKKIQAENATDFSALLISEGAPELSGKTFDAIFTLMALHHIEDIGGTLGLFRRLISSSGTLFISDLVEEDGSFHGDNFSGHHGFRQETLNRQLQEAGFSRVTFEICHTMKQERGGKLKSFPIFLATATC